ncbi:MAG: hypothetical protein NTV34_11130 [Proteobacteria bacterium]|nr:hypothetical protein [Pseudomonadota bacterium]
MQQLMSVFGLGIASGGIALSLGCRSNTEFSAPQKKSYEAMAVYKNSFLASEVTEGQKEITEGGRFESNLITLAEKPITVTPMRQVERQVKKLYEQQGHDSSFTKENFTVTAAGLLDLLIVIDDSRSMREEQIELGSKLEPLLSEIKETNWQIAVVSMSDPCVKTTNLIKKTDANIERKFAAAVKKEDDLNATEQGFPMAIQSLQGQCRGKIVPWTRPGSSIGVLVVSDEDNCGTGAEELRRCRFTYGKNADEMLEFLYHLRTPELTRIYALVKQDVSSCPSASGVGTEYLKAVTASGGVSGSICASDYSQALAEISKNVNDIVKYEFKLSKTPDLKKFTVDADGVEVPAGEFWTLNAKDRTVRIDPEAFKKSKSVTFSYSYGAIDKFDSIKIEGTVSPKTLEVKINGVVQSEATYDHDDDKDVLKFNVIPPDDAQIYATWREDKALLVKFNLSDTEIREDTLEIQVSGKVIPKTGYSFTGTVIEFPEPPADGASIVASYRTENHKITAYELSMTRKPEAISAKDEATGAEVPIQLEGSEVQFSRNQIVAGRKVHVSIDYGTKPPVYEIVLPEKALEDSILVKVNGNDVGCTASESENGAASQGNSPREEDDKGDHLVSLTIRLLGETSNLTVTCPAENPDHSVVKVAYKYEINRKSVFQVPDTVPLGDTYRPTGWKIFINGAETTEFKREERKITLEEIKLSPGAKVDIEATVWRRLD